MCLDAFAGRRNARNRGHTVSCEWTNKHGYVDRGRQVAGGRKRVNQGDRGGGGRCTGGVKAVGNSRSGAATPVTSVGALANQ